MFPFLSTPATFLRAPSSRAAANRIASSSAPSPLFVLAGVPWDGAVTNRPGSRFGPSRIRAASHMICDGVHPLFDTAPVPPPGSSSPAHLIDIGDINLPNTSLEPMRRELEKFVATSDAFDSKDGDVLLPVFLGGDHSITLSTIRGMRARRKMEPEQKFACIHFDAHCDTWLDHFGEPSGHGTWVKDAIEGYQVEGGEHQKQQQQEQHLPLIDPECTFQIGIRSSGDEAARNYVSHRGGTIWTGRDMRGMECPSALREHIVDKIIASLAKKNFPPVYLSFDIDALDPAFAPGTGTPEPGGLSSNQALTLIEELSARPELKGKWVAMDMVEVAPAYDDASGSTSTVAATLVWTWMAGVMSRY